MSQQPALRFEPAAVAHQRAVLSDDSMTRHQYGEMVGGRQPADLTGMEAGAPSDLVVRARLPEADLPKRAVHGHLCGREIEPVTEMPRKRKAQRLAGEVGIEPRRGDGACALGN